MAVERAGAAREAVERAGAREDARAVEAPAEKWAHPEGERASETLVEGAGSEEAATATRAPRVAREEAREAVAREAASAALRAGSVGEACQAEREGGTVAGVARGAEGATEGASSGRRPRIQGHPRLPMSESL